MEDRRNAICATVLLRDVHAADGNYNVFQNVGAATAERVAVQDSKGHNYIAEKLFVAHLHPGLCESNPHGDLLSHEYVRIVGLREAAFQFIQLRGREAGTMSLLLRRFVGVRGRAGRQALLLLLLLLPCLLRRQPRRLTQRRCSQATGVVIRVAAVVQVGGLQLGMVAF